MNPPLPDMDVNCKVTAAPIIDEGNMFRTPMEIVEGQYKGTALDIVSSRPEIYKYLPFDIGSLFVVMVRNGAASIKMPLGPDHNTQR